MIVFTSLNRHFILQAPNQFREFPKTFTTTSEFIIHSGLIAHSDVNFKISVIMGDLFLKVFSALHDILKTLSNTYFFFIGDDR